MRPGLDEIRGALDLAQTCACLPGTCRGGEVIDGKLANGQRCKATIPVPTPTPTPAGIGDVTSDEKGSGARYNAGKPDFSLVPIEMMAAHFDVLMPQASRLGALPALESLGIWQRTQDENMLLDVLTRLGLGGWVECAQVFEYGKKKYAAWNWAKGMPWSVPVACAARHLIAMLQGQETDPESGLPHRGHVFCNVVMLLQYTRTYPEGNDLPKKGLL